MTPEASIIVKSFNRPDSLRACLRSLQGGGYLEAWQLVVVDDSGPLHALECRRIAAGFGALVVALPEDSGISAGRNAGVEFCRTEYAFIFDDDQTFPESSNLRELLAAVRYQPGRIAAARKAGKKTIGWNMEWNRPSSLILHPIAEDGRPAVPVDMSCNCFCARRADLIASPWNPALKVAEHSEFFARWPGSAVVVPAVAFRDAKARPPGYRVFRRRPAFKRLRNALLGVRRQFILSAAKTPAEVSRIIANRGQSRP